MLRNLNTHWQVRAEQEYFTSNMLKQFAYKQFGFIRFNNDETLIEQIYQLTNFIKVLFLKAGGTIIIDFKKHKANSDTLFFINKSQVFKLKVVDQLDGVLRWLENDGHKIPLG